MDLVIPENNLKISVTDYVYSVIRDNIMEWHLKPGTRISEKEISEILNVSRTPVREAFIKLAGEELLEIKPQRGTYVSFVDLDHVEEARFIRESLECSVINLVVEKGLTQVIQEMDNSIKQQKCCLLEKDYHSFGQYDEIFHKSIFEACGKERTWEFIQQSNTQYTRLRMLCLRDDPKPELLIEHHEKILEAIIAMEKEKAEKALRSHLKKILKDLGSVRSKYPDYFKV